MLPSFDGLADAKEESGPQRQAAVLLFRPEDNDEAEERASRIYRFRLRGNSYRLEGLAGGGPGGNLAAD